MSVMYATLSDLAAYLKQDVDNSTGTLALQVASQLFSTRANTMFVPTTVTHQVEGFGYRALRLPYRPIVSVSAVRIVSDAGGTSTITGYTRVRSVLYWLNGFGTPGVFPPDMVEVDLVHGYSAPTDDVKGAVLETAAAAYVSPDITTVRESIDDYTVQSSATAGGVQLSQSAYTLAGLYRGTFAA